MADLKSFVDELKQRLPVSQVAGRHVRLQKRGQEWVGLSPFTNEKSPSFTVNDAKGFWHCFSSGKHGDIISFVEETQKLEFMDVLRQLAELAGLPMPSLDRERRQERYAPLAAALEAAAQWFGQQLRAPSGHKAAAYVSERGISGEARQIFRIGYAPASRNNLKKALTDQGIEEKVLVEAGLLIRPPDGGETYDRFRDRLMFPIMDARGRVIAFGGRDCSGRAKAKYLNSPETPLFHKGRVLYGLSQAKAAARQKNQLIVVEGYTDVIALHGAGFQHCAAGLGTALTESQIHLMWGLASEPVICLDGDEAGQRAARRLMERALPELKEGHALRFALLPAGRDPDDIIRESGAAALGDIITRARPLSEMIYAAYMEGADIDTPERKASYAKLFADLAGRIRDADIRHYYQQMFRTRLNKKFWQFDRKHTDSFAPPPITGRAGNEAILLGLLLAWPSLIADRHGRLENLYFARADYAALRDALLHAYDQYDGQSDGQNDGALSAESLRQKVAPEAQTLIGAIYGCDEHGKADGRIYRQRFPLHLAGEEFAGQCLDHLCNRQDLTALQSAREEAAHDYAAQPDSESMHKRLQHICQQITAAENRLRETEQDLASAGREQTEQAGGKKFDWGSFLSQPV